jgi:hypothetical protein
MRDATQSAPMSFVLQRRPARRDMHKSFRQFDLSQSWNTSGTR